MNTDEFSTDAAATGGITGSQPAGARSPGRRRRPRRLWRRAVAGAAVATASLAALTAGAAAAHADTLPNSPTVQLGSYTIPSTPAAGVPGYGDALPTIPGTLGNPTELFMTQDSSGSTTVLRVKGGSSAWGTPVESATSSYATPGILAGQIWRFQLVGYIDISTTAARTGHGGMYGMLQKLPVYKIIDYHPDGTHTCLDAGSNPASGSMIDSYGCDPQQFNQTNQLWIIADSSLGQKYPILYPNLVPYTPGGEAEFLPGWLSADLQNDPLALPNSSNSVIENVAALQASGWNTDQAPVLSASYTNITGVNSLVVLRAQQYPVNRKNSTWAVYDTTTSTTTNESGGGPVRDCTSIQCLFESQII